MATAALIGYICVSCPSQGRRPMRSWCACAPRASIRWTGKFARGNCGSSFLSIFLMSRAATSPVKSLATGAGAAQFRSGDPVVGFVNLRRGGGYAEFAVAKKTAIALKPPSLSFVEAASLPIAACTALQALRDLGKLSEGANALILGGAGGVGHFAVQIAKALGAKTTATCGASNIEFVRSLGADHVIDYRREDFTTRTDRYDVIFDAVGKSSFPVCRPLLEPDGTYVTTLPGPRLFFWTAVQSIAGFFGAAKRAKGVLVRQSGSDIAFLCQLADEGKLRPTVSLKLPLDRAAEAQEASEAGHTRGKIVLEV